MSASLIPSTISPTQPGSIPVLDDVIVPLAVVVVLIVLVVLIELELDEPPPPVT
jgi:hypothetical protein